MDGVEDSSGQPPLYRRARSRRSSALSARYIHLQRHRMPVGARGGIGRNSRPQSVQPEALSTRPLVPTHTAFATPPRSSELEIPVVVGTARAAMSARRSRRTEGMSWRVGAAPQGQAQPAACKERETGEQGSEGGHDGGAGPVGLCWATADVGDWGNRTCACLSGRRRRCRDGDAVLLRGASLSGGWRCES
jgi:hypothetical protein